MVAAMASKQRINISALLTPNHATMQRHLIPQLMLEDDNMRDYLGHVDNDGKPMNLTLPKAWRLPPHLTSHLPIQTVRAIAHASLAAATLCEQLVDLFGDDGVDNRFAKIFECNAWYHGQMPSGGQRHQLGNILKLRIIPGAVTMWDQRISAFKTRVKDWQEYLTKANLRQEQMLAKMGDTDLFKQYLLWYDGTVSSSETTLGRELDVSPYSFHGVLAEIADKTPPHLRIDIHVPMRRVGKSAGNVLQTRVVYSIYRGYIASPCDYLSAKERALVEL